MVSIVSAGIGSGLDINSIVSELVEFQKQPQLQRLEARETRLQERLSGLGMLRSALSSLQTSLTDLKALETFRGRTAQSGDEAVLRASAGSGAAAGVYDVSVDQLALAHSLSTDPATLEQARFTSPSDNIGTGTLTFRFGATDYDPDTGAYNGFEQNPDRAIHTVNITDGSMTGVRDAINAADIGVNASIIFDGNHYRLTLAATETGAANGMEISAEGEGLSILEFNAGSTAMQQTRAARDTEGLVVNGIAISSSSNTLDDVIEGLSIELRAPGSTSVTVARDEAGMTGAIQEFVEQFNGLVTTINELSRFNPETGETGLLNGDHVLSTVDGQMRRLLNQSIGGPDSPFRYLADIGITRNVDDGTLQLDESRLQRAMNEDFDAIASLFSTVGMPTDSMIGFDGAGRSAQPGRYGVEVTQLATRGAVTGSAAAGLNITAGVNDRLALSVNGVATTVTLTAGSYDSPAALAAELQARINGADAIRNAGISVNVSVTDGVLGIISDRYGTDSTVAVTGGNGNAHLFGSAPVATAGLDVAGMIGGVEARGVGQTLIGVGNAEGLRLQINGGELGNRGTVTFSRGYGEGLDRMISSLLLGDGALNNATDSTNRSMREITDQREQVELRSLSYEEQIRARFSAMDSLVAQLRSTGDFLTQQLDNLPRINQGRR